MPVRLELLGAERRGLLQPLDAWRRAAPPRRAPRPRGPSGAAPPGRTPRDRSPRPRAPRSDRRPGRSAAGSPARRPRPPWRSPARWRRRGRSEVTAASARSSWFTRTTAPLAVALRDGGAQLRVAGDPPQRGRERAARRPRRRDSAVRTPVAMPASALPVSLCAASRRSTTARAIIGTITMIVKKTRRRPRKLIRLSPSKQGYPCFSAPEPPRLKPASPLPSTCFSYRRGACGAIAQLEERLDRTQEVGGSSPPSSIALNPATG